MFLEICQIKKSFGAGDSRVEAVKQADEAYANFGGLAEEQTGSVKFIIETDEIKH